MVLETKLQVFMSTLKSPNQGVHCHLSKINLNSEHQTNKNAKYFSQSPSKRQNAVIWHVCYIIIVYMYTDKIMVKRQIYAH